MTKELTHGKPLPLILQFAMPLIFGYMLQQLYSLCDTVIVGRCLGVNELAAVGSTGAVSFSAWFCNWNLYRNVYSSFTGIWCR